MCFFGVRYTQNLADKESSAMEASTEGPDATSTAGRRANGAKLLFITKLPHNSTSAGINSGSDFVDGDS